MIYFSLIAFFNPFYSILSMEQSNSENLKLVIGLFRSGPRSDFFKVVSNNTNLLSEPEFEHSEIKNTGLHQSYMLGRELSKRYAHILHDYSQVTCKSSINGVSQSSLISLVQGLFANKKMSVLESEITDFNSSSNTDFTPNLTKGSPTFPKLVSLLDIQTINDNELKNLQKGNDFPNSLFKDYFLRMEPHICQKYEDIFRELNVRLDDIGYSYHGIFDDLNESQLSQTYILCDIILSNKATDSDYLIIRKNTNVTNSTESNIIEDCVIFSTFAKYLFAEDRILRKKEITPVNKIIFREIKEYVDRTDPAESVNTDGDKIKQINSQNPNFVFLLFGDDFISNFLANFVAKNSECVSEFYLSDKSQKTKSKENQKCILDSKFGENLLLEFFKDSTSETLKVRLLRNGELFPILEKNELTFQEFSELLQENSLIDLELSDQLIPGVDFYLTYKLLGLVVFTLVVIVVLTIFLILFIQKSKEEIIRPENLELPFD